MSYLPCPDTTIGCARGTHLGNMSRKRSGEVPTHDAQPPDAPGSQSGKIVPQFLCLAASPRTHRPSTRVAGALRLYTAGACPHMNTLGDCLPLRTHLPTQRGVPKESKQNWDCWTSTLFPDWDPGAAGGCASHVGTSPLSFRDMLLKWVPRAQPMVASGQKR